MAGKRKKITFIINDKGCHICTSHHIGTHGYPCVFHDGRNQNLHRVLYEEKFGPLGNLLARHKCDDARCINLDHIETGTAAQNTADATERGRHNPPHGVRSGTAKLSEGQVDAIRAESGTHQEIANRYNVNQSTITRIKSGQRRLKG